MGFMDKMKSAAGDAAVKAKEAAGQAQEKIDNAQKRKKIAEKKQELGDLIYRERTQGVPAGVQADSLVTEISALEASLESQDPGSGAAATPGGPLDAAAPPPSTSASEDPPGDLKL